MNLLSKSDNQLCPLGIPADLALSANNEFTALFMWLHWTWRSVGSRMENREFRNARQRWSALWLHPILAVVIESTGRLSHCHSTGMIDGVSSQQKHEDLWWLSNVYTGSPVKFQIWRRWLIDPSIDRRLRPKSKIRKLNKKSKNNSALPIHSTENDLLLWLFG